MLQTGLIPRYFKWLQQDNPVGFVERYPQTNDQYESTLKGVYIAGDLTGVPLLKLAAESGPRIIQILVEDDSFQRARKSKGDDLLDVLILGAGPAGIAAALACEQEGLRYQVLEASKLFNTIESFPKGKPILAKPDAYQQSSGLTIQDGTKESLLRDLEQAISGKNLNIQLGAFAKQIHQRATCLEVETAGASLRSLRVVLAIGKSGNYRRLRVPGEDLPHVTHKLYDPSDYVNEKVLVIGGGDTALETASALSQAGNSVVHSYRKAGFDRPKPETLERFQQGVAQGQIETMMESQVVEITPEHARIKTPEEERTVAVNHVFVMIGREPPLDFFKRSGIRMEGEKDRAWSVFLVTMISFFTMLYFGKAGNAVDLFADTTGILGKGIAYLKAPLQVRLPFGIAGQAWLSSLNFYLGWLGSLVFLVSGLGSLGIMWQRRSHYLGYTWNRVKYGYLISAGILFTIIYFDTVLGKTEGWVEEPTYWYSLLYCTTMALFGLRRILVHKTRYIKIQVLTLVSIQVLFLFLLPFHLFESWIQPHFAPDSFVMTQMFPNGKWSSFGFILFWPLNMNDFGTSTFWVVFPIFQTFGLLFALVYFYGKGAYCSWICSCGGMAETLGDEYRSLAPHGPYAKRLENIGQGVLLFAIVTTLLGFISKVLPDGGVSGVADLFKGIYKLGIDVFFAGVLGLGVYFFMGGRIWCRFGCPLAALMHIYNRFGVYRIVSEKKKCISCNVCTKVCHMGIDVMNYANKGIPLNDTECVRCSACVHSCPTAVLSFARIKKGDSQNQTREAVPEYGKEDWRAGIR